MLDAQPDLSSDLEWVLQSDQASPEMILEILIDQYYAAVFQITYAILADHQSAHRAVEAAFKLAVLEKYRYQGGVSAETWLYRLALQAAYQLDGGRRLRSKGEPFGHLPGRQAASETDQLLLIAIGNLQPEERLILLLREVQGRSVSAIAQLMETEAGGIFAILSQARRPVLEILDAREPEYQTDDHALSERLQKIWPAGHLDPGEKSDLLQSVRQQILQSGARRRWQSAVKETALIALVVLLAFAVFRSADQILPEDEVTPTPAQRALVTQLVLVEVTATPPPTATTRPPRSPELSYPSRSVFYAARESDTLASIASRLDIRLELLRSLNQDLEADQLLESGELVVVATRPAPSPTPFPEPVVIPGPLDSGASPEEVLARIKDSRGLWTTFWADSMIIYHGPPGYVGKPQIRRDQVWVNQPYSSLVLSGEVQGQPDQVWFSLDGKVYDIDIRSGRPTLYDFHSMQLPVYSDVSELVFPATLADSIENLEVTGAATVAGRPALEVRWRSIEQRSVRAWIDREYGIPLWIVEYAAGEVPEREIRLVSVDFDVPFPDSLFDRNRLLTRFAGDYRGQTEAQSVIPIPLPSPSPGHQSLERRPAPAGFEASQSRLTFQWSQPEVYNAFEFSWGASRTLGVDESFWQPMPVDVFAGEFYLGSMVFSPWNAVCRRSPDGNRLALVRYDMALSREMDYFHWVSLDDLEDLGSLERFFLPEGHLAWSPDGRYLALSGCTLDERCGVYLLDVVSQRFWRAISAGNADHLAWSPDGTRLAAMGLLPTSVTRGVQVVDAASGELVYSAEADSKSGALPSDSPTYAWEYDPSGADASVLQGGLSNCAEFPVTP